MKINFSKFLNPDIRRMIQAALDNDGKISLAEMQQMRQSELFTKDVENELNNEYLNNVASRRLKKDLPIK